MERAGRVLRSLNVPGGASLDAEALARAAWPHVVGKKIAGRTRPVGYHDGLLTIEVTDSVWLTQLRGMRLHIVHRLQEVAGADTIRDIRLVAGAPKKDPRRAGQSRAADEAEGIEDPVLRRIYRASRQRSLA